MRSRARNRRSGEALIEFALMLPTFILLCVAGVDFGRVFNAAIMLTGATRAALEYAGQSSTTAGDTTGITNAVKTAAGNPTGLSVTPTQFCTCSIGGAQVSCTNTCAGKIAYVKITTSLPFRAVANWPVIPSSLNLTASGSIRVP